MLVKKNSSRLAILLLATLLLSACTSPTVLPTSTPTPTEETANQPEATSIPQNLAQPSATPAMAAQPPALNEAQLKNATYLAPQSGQTERLQNGKYEGGSGASYLSLTLLPQIAFGDLNGDGLDDAALLLAENTGGSGVFVSLLALLNRDGLPFQAASSFVDDRPQIDSLSIQDGHIVLQAVVHQASDPMVSPSLAVTRTFQLAGDVLTQISEVAVTSTATPLNEPITLNQLHMIDETTGWGVDNNGRLMRTTDGAQTWTDVTPPIQTSNPFFLDAQTAWAYSVSDPSSGLLRTVDGGQTWSTVAATLPFSGYTTFIFQNENDGWAELYDVGAGNAYIQLYETHDGGATWTQVMLKMPDGTGENPGVLHLCNICGDYFYFDLQRMLIIYGELANEPAGKLQLALSLDQGQTWQQQSLPFPAQGYASGLVSPQAPVFFTETQGLLPFGLISYNSDGSYGIDIMTVYATHDGGLTWSTNPTVVEGAGNPRNNAQLLSMTDGFVPCGQDLCATQDGGESWQALGSNLSFAYTSDSDPYVWKFQFVNPTTGWAITDLNGQSALWHTTDGGHTWEGLSPVIVW